MMMRSLFIFALCLLFTTVTRVYAVKSTARTDALVRDFIEKKISKKIFLTNIKKTQLPFTVKDVELINVNGYVNVRWYFSGTDYLAVKADCLNCADIQYLKGKITKEEALNRIRSQSPYFVKDINIKKSGNVKYLEWKITNLPFTIPDQPVTKKPTNPQITFKNDIQRKLASGNITQTQISTQAQEPLQQTTFLNTSIGNTVLRKDSNEIDMKFASVSVNHRIFVGDRNSIDVGISVNKYFSVTHSDSYDKVNPNSVYPEGEVKFLRKFRFLNLGLGYKNSYSFSESEKDQDTILVEIKRIHRLSLLANYELSDSWSIQGDYGRLSSFSNHKISGQDGSVGTSYSFGERNRYRASLNLRNTRFESSSQNVLTNINTYTLGLGCLF